MTEPYGWDEMGLITDGGTNQVPDSANITIIYPGHPMAAGYNGDVPVYTNLPGSSGKMYFDDIRLYRPGIAPGE